MGGTISSRRCDLYFLRTKTDMVNTALPLYYISQKPTEYEYSIAKKSWGQVLQNQAPAYLELSKDPTFKYTSCISFFYDTYYLRFFEVHPSARALFTNLKSRGRALVRMVSFCLRALYDTDDIHRELIGLAEMHHYKGVTPYEYGIVGEVLIWTLAKVLGHENFTLELRYAWVKIFSSILKVIVPAAVELEILDSRNDKNGKNDKNKDSESDAKTNKFSIEDRKLSCTEMLSSTGSSCTEVPKETGLNEEQNIETFGKLETQNSVCPF